MKKIALALLISVATAVALHVAFKKMENNELFFSSERWFNVD